MAPKRKISPFALFSLPARVTKFHFCVHFLFSLSFSLSFSAVNHASKPRARSGSLSIFLAEGIFFTRVSCCRVLYFFPSSVKPYHHKVFSPLAPEWVVPCVCTLHLSRLGWEFCSVATKKRALWFSWEFFSPVLQLLFDPFFRVSSRPVARVDDDYRWEDSGENSYRTSSTWSVPFREDSISNV